MVSNICNWNDIKSKFIDNSSLLLGNGFSINIHKNFNYKSLYEHAKHQELNKCDQELFKLLKTENFEYVLRIIKHAELYYECYKTDAKAELDPTEQYKRIREALVKTIQDIHCQWSEKNSETFEKIAQELTHYKSIFTTNYDLLLYWAIMTKKKSFKDFFWGEKFDLSDSQLWGSSTLIYYLHGSLFLYHNLDTYDYKRKRDDYHNLLDVIENLEEKEESFLIVAEGESDQKHKSISNSEYLEFCLNSFKNLIHNLSNLLPPIHFINHIFNTCLSKS